MPYSGAVEVAAEFTQQFEVALQVFISGLRVLEVAVIGIAVGAYRSSLRQRKWCAVVFRQVTAGGIGQQVNRLLHTPGNNGNFTGPQGQVAALGAQQ